ncbi:MAG: HD domain-containing protein, partial [Acidimicrobiales bacterium]
WADRIAYVCHDWEDAVFTGIVSPDRLPPLVRDKCGESRSRQLRAFITELVETVSVTGCVAMTETMAEALSEFRRCNYEHVYLRPASVAQGSAVIEVLKALVEQFADHPYSIPDVRRAGGLEARTDAAVRAAVGYVAGMTDRFAMERALCDLGWDPGRLPRGIESFSRTVT